MSKATDDLEKHFGLPKNFFHELQMQSDWSFVVNLHSLVETACGELLAQELGHPEITEAFAKVQMGYRGNGKLAFLLALKLLAPHEIAFVESFGDLRNKFAHDVTRTQSTIEEMVAEMSSEKRREWRKAIGMGMQVKFSDTERSAAEVAKDSAKTVIWVASSRVLRKIHLQMIAARMRNELVATKIAEHIKENGPFRLREGEASFGDLR